MVFPADAVRNIVFNVNDSLEQDNSSSELAFANDSRSQWPPSNLGFCDHNLTEEEKELNNFSTWFHFVVYSVLLNVIGIFGIVGNIISMIILSRPQMKSSINYLLIGLARCDTVLIITSILLFGLPSINDTTQHLFIYDSKIYPMIAPVVYPVAMISQTISVYLTVLVTVERFVAVCHPLRARSFCTYGRARLFVCIVVLFAIVYNITRFWEVEIEECAQEHDGIYVAILKVRPSAIRNNQRYINWYIHWLYLIVMYIAPFSFLVLLNSCIYAQVGIFLISFFER